MLAVVSSEYFYLLRNCLKKSRGQAIMLSLVLKLGLWPRRKEKAFCGQRTKQYVWAEKTTCDKRIEESYVASSLQIFTLHRTLCSN